jgi:antitoxin (DNA-binding transcriptional repressor) of toxin-antitoxin stability system
MKTVNIHEAKTQLSRLVNLALEGEDVIISRRRKPLVRLSVVQEQEGKRKIGTCPDLIVQMSDNALDPLEDYEDSLLPNLS